jgi:hypothetical protein
MFLHFRELCFELRRYSFIVIGFCLKLLVQYSLECMCSSWGSKLYTKDSYFEELEHIVVLFPTMNILLGRRERILNKQLGMEVYVNLCMIWRLEWTFATSKNFIVRTLIFSYCSICKYAFFPPMVELMCDFTDYLIVIYHTDFLKIYQVLFLILFQPAQPRLAHVVSGKVEPIMLAPIPYEFIA